MHTKTAASDPTPAVEYGGITVQPLRVVSHVAKTTNGKLRKLVPFPAYLYARTRAESKHLNKLGKMPADTTALSTKIDSGELQKIFSSRKFDEA
jgi:hypothetical protein